MISFSSLSLLSFSLNLSLSLSSFYLFIFVPLILELCFHPVPLFPPLLAFPFFLGAKMSPFFFDLFEIICAAIAYHVQAQTHSYTTNWTMHIYCLFYVFWNHLFWSIFYSMPFEASNLSNTVFCMYVVVMVMTVWNTYT